MAMSSGKVNETELVAALINQEDDFVSGIKHVQEKVEGSMTLLLMTEEGNIIAARDRLGRLPVLIGKNQKAIALHSSRSLTRTSIMKRSTSWAPPRS